MRQASLRTCSPPPEPAASPEGLLRASRRVCGATGERRGRQRAGLAGGQGVAVWGEGIGARCLGRRHPSQTGRMARMCADLLR